MYNERNLVFIHGSGQSAISWNFYSVFLPEHNALHIDYDVRDDIFLVEDRIKKQITNFSSGQSVTIVAHSYGCLISALLLDSLSNIDCVIALSPPWGGSQTARWLSKAFRSNTLFKNTTPNSVVLEKIKTIETAIPVYNIITTGGSNALAGLGSETGNDGMITVKSQSMCPETFRTQYSKTFALSHSEVLLSMDVIDYITTIIQGEHDVV
jgi:pimeloyl-ACP methyl ester carboxylesterase